LLVFLAPSKPQAIVDPKSSVAPVLKKKAVSELCPNYFTSKTKDKDQILITFNYNVLERPFVAVSVFKLCGIPQLLLDDVRSFRYQ